MKKVILALMCILMSASLTGCAVDVGDFDLTESEEEAIVGYAADLLLKYDVNYQNNIVDTSKQRELRARVAAIKELNAKAREEGSDSETSSNTNSKDSGNKEVKELGAASGEQNLSVALAQNDFNIEYKGVESCTSYSSGEMFSLDASAGKELLVLHFDIANTAAEEKQCNIINQNPMFSLVVNNSERKKALTTILLNDLATVDETIAPGEHYDSVVVFETEPGYADGIEKMSLQAKYNGGESVILLK